MAGAMPPVQSWQHSRQCRVCPPGWGYIGVKHLKLSAQSIGSTPPHAVRARIWGMCTSTGSFIFRILEGCCTLSTTFFYVQHWWSCFAQRFFSSAILQYYCECQQQIYSMEKEVYMRGKINDELASNLVNANKEDLCTNLDFGRQTQDVAFIIKYN